MCPPGPDQRVADLAAREWAVLSVYELRSCGMSNSAIRSRVSRGLLHSIHRGVVAVGHRPLTCESWFMAAVKACGPTAALSHFAAAAHLGALEWDDRRPEVTVAASGTRLVRGVTVHRTRTLEPQDVITWRAIRVTSPARTALDLAARVSFRDLRRVVRNMHSRGLLTVDDLLDVIDRRSGRSGTRNLRRIVASGPAPTRSVLEDVVLDLILAGGLDRPDVNVPIVIEGRRLIPDFRWPGQHLVVEADGAAWHDGAIARADDAERQALLEAHGERVVRVSWQQAVLRGTQTLARLRAAGAPPAREST